MNRMPRSSTVQIIAGLLLLVLAALVQPASAQTTYGEPRFDRPALDAMLAPVALYPDPLLSHVLMAATYPREIDEAARWLRDRPGLSGDAAVRSSEGWDWDPSVRSLLAFPQVLQTLADYPRWTDDLGEAFLAQREEVMDTIQQLRRRALAAGTLRSNESTRVVDNGYAITIEPVAAHTVYVPYYDPRVAYGSWWWPARPPMYWSRWPGYSVPPGRDPYLYWGPGVYLGSSFFFGNFVWARREVRVVDVRPYYYPRSVVIERQVVPGRPIIEHRPPAPDVWRHDARRRYADDRRDFRPSEPARPAATAPRSFDDRGGPREERRGFERRDAPAAPPARVAPAPVPRAPEPITVVPAQPVPPAVRMDGRDSRAERPNREREEVRTSPRNDERRNAAPDSRDRRPPAAAQEGPRPGQGQPDANGESRRRGREGRD